MPAEKHSDEDKTHELRIPARGLNTAQAAEYMGCTESYIHAAKRAGVLLPVKFGKKDVYYTETLDRHMDDRAAGTRDPTVRVAPDHTGT